eukprot:scaffold154_cov129-Cylindrotheca_fusiformis.AAC.40
MADSFRKKSKCGFWNCVAAIDGMLVWTSQPSESTDDMGIGPSKFCNGRKCKSGIINMQGICGPNKKFLDITCSHPVCALLALATLFPQQNQSASQEEQGSSELSSHR